MPEEYKIEIESTGGYQTKKAFNKIVSLTERQYMSLVTAVLDHLEVISDENWGVKQK